MQKPFEIHKAPPMPGNMQPAPLRAETRYPHTGATGHVRGVEASSQGLLRSTLKAGGIAAFLLVVFYLPSEYGKDLTGLGGVLGLTEMGQIKQQLLAEATADAAAGSNTASIPADLVARLDRMQSQITNIAAVIGADGTASPVPAAAPAPASVPASPVETPPPVAAAASEWKDEASYLLPPGEGVEVKLVMQEGQTARFEWTANGSVVNYQTHGDDGGRNNIAYEEGRAIPEKSGELTAAFTGNHGWFWRNRTAEPVTLTIRTRGDYSVMKRP